MAAPPTSDACLSPDSLLRLMNKNLPKDSDDDRQLLKSPFAAIALLCHACMLAAGFRLVGLGEDHTIESQSDQEEQPLPHEWDATPTSSATYAFRYVQARAQASDQYLLKVSRLGGKALVFGIGLGDDDKTASFEVNARDYISDQSLKEETFATTNDHISALGKIFISADKISDLANLVETNIIQTVAASRDAQKPGTAGHEDSTAAAAAAAAAVAATATREQPSRGDYEAQRPDHHDDPLQDEQPTPAKPFPLNDPLAAAPRHPQPSADFPPPGFEDEYELNSQPRGSATGGIGGAQPFGNIGERDLYPPGLAPHDPLRIGPGLGVGGRSGGGMHPTFDDPLFGGTAGGIGGIGGLGGLGGSGARAPPGARYDPIGPGDRPPSLRGGGLFPGGGRRGGGGGFGGNPFSAYGSGDFI